MIVSFATHEFAVATVFNNLSFGHHEDAVAANDCREAVSDDDARPTLKNFIHSRLNDAFAFRVDTLGRLVKDEKAGIADDGTGRGGEVFLAAR